jgi:uncharacterized membrane protein YfcA
MMDWLLPATDAGVAAQATIVVVFWVGALLATRRRDPDIRIFVAGFGFFVLAVMAVRAVLH